MNKLIIEQVSAWTMTAVILLLITTIFVHKNLLATWLAFSASWFAWRVVILRIELEKK